MEKVDTIVVDKTGTLTQGRPEVTAIETYGNWKEVDVIRLAASVESQSEHPLAQAIIRRAKKDEMKIETATDFNSITGGGVQAKVDDHSVLIGNAEWIRSGIGQDLRSEQKSDDSTKLLSSSARSMDEATEQASKHQDEGATVIFIAIDGQLAAIIAVSDPIKESTPAALKTLHELGLKVVMLTGDAEPTAKAVAAKLRIDEFHAGVSPAEKHAFIKQLKSEGKIVAMAGDGINDAPALAEANVGIAMGTGTGVAIESAGVTLVGGDLRGVAAAVNLSRKTMRNIRQNLFFAFIYNALGIPVAAGLLYPFFGILLSPMIAAAAMSLSSVSVIANALRLRSVDLT